MTQQQQLSFHFFTFCTARLCSVLAWSVPVAIVNSAVLRSLLPTSWTGVRTADGEGKVEGGNRSCCPPDLPDLLYKSAQIGNTLRAALKNILYKRAKVNKFTTMDATRTTTWHMLPVNLPFTHLVLPLPSLLCFPSLPLTL